MSWSELSAGFRPVSMRRVAVVAPGDRLRDALVQVADAGTVETDVVVAPGDRAAGEAARRLQRLAAATGGTPSSTRPPPCLSPESPDLDRLAELGRADLLAGEAELEERLADAARQGSVAALTGWAPSDALPGLAERLTPIGAAVVPLPRPPGRTPPTLLAARTRGGAGGSAGGALVDTYATVPYDDVDPTTFAVLAYLLMFGIMFADAGHGLLLVGVALLLRVGRPARLARYRSAWRFVAGAGVVSTLVGVAYGEFFGPTGVVPALLVDPLEEPLPLLAAAVGVGAVLLAVAYAIGTVNRVREGGWSYALYAPSGIAGAALFLGLGLVAAGVVGGSPIPTAAGVVVSGAGLALSFAGLRAAAGPGAGGAVEAVIELVDVVIRVGANLVSFARLAAFGMTHAALAAVVWSGTVALWDRGPVGVVGAVAVFLAGTALTFGLEALVAGIQALRLEYYELFSRVFQAEGRPFRPWHVPVATRAGVAELEEVES
jgi:V/A-type H+/Na+-transporting ATPase subunit I